MTDPAAEPAPYRDQLAELAARIAEQLGPERDSEITAHLARLAAREEPDPGPALERAHGALQQAPGVPADAGEHRGRAATAAALRQLADEVAAHRAALDAVLAALAASFRPATHHHPDLEGELDALHDRFAAAERARSWSPTDLDTAARLDALERAQRADDAAPWPSRDEALVAVRGPGWLGPRRQVVADAIAAHGGPVLELGCGDGGLLRLLHERGVECRGVDDDADAVQAAQGRGLPVERRGALEALAAGAPGSLAAVAVLEVERVTPAELVEVVALSADRLRRGGLLALGGADPSSLGAHAGSLHLEPGTRPAHPAYVRYLCEAAGFVQVEVQGGAPAGDRLPQVDGDDAPLVDGVNGVIARLNDLLFGPQDFTVLATR